VAELLHKYSRSALCENDHANHTLNESIQKILKLTLVNHLDDSDYVPQTGRAEALQQHHGLHGSASKLL